MLAIDDIVIPAAGADTAKLVAGFVYGLTGDNNLVEIEQCFQDGGVMLHEIETGINDVKQGGINHILQGVLNFALVALQIPESLEDCKGMDDDIAAIEEWASIIKTPSLLAATVAKNLAFHKKAIQADIATVEADFEAGAYWQTGIAVADLATLAIGPIKPVYPEDDDDSAYGLSAMAVPDFIAGLLYGFTGDNNLSTIEDCAAGGSQTIADAEKAISAILSFDVIKAGIAIDNVINDVEHELSACPADVKYDLKALGDWASIFTDPIRLPATVGKNWLLHERGIKKDIAHEKADWAAGNYFAAGVDTADAFVKLIGPVEPSPSVFGFDAMAIPDFIAGFIYGFTGDNQLKNIEGCFQGSTSIYVNIRVGIDNLQEEDATWFDYTEAALNFGEAAAEIPAALSSCKGIGSDITEIEEWAEIFAAGNRTKLVATLTKNWAFHRKAIQADLAEVKSDWNSKDYFDSGAAAADALVIAVGTV